MLRSVRLFGYNRIVGGSLRVGMGPAPLAAVLDRLASLRFCRSNPLFPPLFSVASDATVEFN
jgi:hypothetical protein